MAPPYLRVRNDILYFHIFIIEQMYDIDFLLVHEFAEYYLDRK